MALGTVRFTAGGNVFAEAELQFASTVIGRRQESGIVLDHISTSRRHARLTVEGGQLNIEDLGQEAEIPIMFQPPRSSQAVATDYNLTLNATSEENHPVVQANANVAISPFESTTMEIRPRRGKKKFRVHAENSGNARVAYLLSGTDDEDAYAYDFARPDILLEPGESMDVPVTVKRKNRKLFGKPSLTAFQAKATPTGRTEAAAETATNGTPSSTADDAGAAPTADGAGAQDSPTDEPTELPTEQPTEKPTATPTQEFTPTPAPVNLNNLQDILKEIDLALQGEDVDEVVKFFASNAFVTIIECPPEQPGEVECLEGDAGPVATLRVCKWEGGCAQLQLNTYLDYITKFIAPSAAYSEEGLRAVPARRHYYPPNHDDGG